MCGRGSWSFAEEIEGSAGTRISEKLQRGAAPTALRMQLLAHPRLLQIQREYIKPGKAGTAHEKTESAFVDAMRRAKWPTNYVGMTSLSGKTRALFLTSYESFDAWEKDVNAVGKNASLSAALERANLADGELQEDGDQGLFYFREDMRMNPRSDLSQFRLFASSRCFT